MTLRLRLAVLFGALLLVLSGLFVISLQGQLVREAAAAQGHSAGQPAE